MLGVAGAYVQAFARLKALARASITFSTPGIGRARLFEKGGGPVSDGTGDGQAADAWIGDLRQKLGDDVSDDDVWYDEGANSLHRLKVVLRLSPDEFTRIVQQLVGR